MLETKAGEIFEYEKNNNRYWNGAKLHQQVVYKALLIAKAFFLGYLFFYLFDNAKCHLVYTKDVLQVQDINKRSGGKQSSLQAK